MADREVVLDFLSHLGQEQALITIFGNIVNADGKHMARLNELITAYNQLRVNYEQRGGEAAEALIASVDAAIDQCRALITALEALLNDRSAKQVSMEERIASVLVRVRPVLEDFIRALGDGDERCETVREVRAFETLFRLKPGFPRRLVCTTEESYAEALKTNLMAVFEQPQQAEQQPQQAEQQPQQAEQQPQAQQAEQPQAQQAEQQPQQAEQQPERAESPTGEPSLKYPKYDTGNWRQSKD